MVEDKRNTVQQNLAAVELVKSRHLALAMGFMLFDPSSTAETIRENLAFLRAVGADGYFPVNFCKMLPYAGTPIEARLRAEGRLRGTPARPDYGYLDPRLDGFEALVRSIFSRRNFGPDNLVAQLQQVDFEYRLARALGRPAAGADAEGLRRLIASTNLLALDTLDQLLTAVTERGVDALLEDRETLVGIAEREWRGEMRAEVELARMRAAAGGQCAAGKAKS